MNELDSSTQALGLYHEAQEKPQNVAKTFVEKKKVSKKTEDFVITNFIFETHFRRWKRETGAHSNTDIILKHPSYIAMIKMGKPVIPLMLDKLNTDPQHLFWALYKISGENPVLEENIGNFHLMINDWLNWGKLNGHFSA